MPKKAQQGVLMDDDTTSYATVNKVEIRKI